MRHALVFTLILLGVDAIGLNPQRQLCFLPEERGHCGGGESAQSQIRWFYDANSGKCRVFTYSGCRGNANNFWDERQCVHHCNGATTERICSMAVDAGGPCQGMATRTRYYYETTAKRCLPFMFAGCGGNQNHFVTAQECQQFCDWRLFGERTAFEQQRSQATELRARCSLMPEHGSCNGRFIQWYFDTYHSRCKPFVYGGCLGNANRFDDEQQCSETCGANVLTVSAFKSICMFIALLFLHTLL